MTDDVLHLLGRADPVPHPDAIDPPFGADEALALARSSQAATERSVARARDDGRDVRSGQRVATLSLAASLIVVLVGSLSFMALRRPSMSPVEPATSAVATPTTPTTTVPTTSVPTTSPGAVDPATSTIAVEQAFGRLVEAVNAGDLDVVLATLGRPMIATFVQGDEPLPDSAPSGTRSDVESMLARLLGEGTTWTDVTCAPAPLQRAQPTISCSFTGRPTVSETVGAPASRVRMLVAGGETIRQLHVAESSPSPSEVRANLRQWLDSVDLGSDDGIAAVDGSAELPMSTGDAVTDARAMGAFEADMAARWAAFLERFDCSWDERCTITLERWVAEYERSCLALDSTVPTRQMVSDLLELPPLDDPNDAVERLLDLDESVAAVGSDGTASDRRALMAELGIDDRCRPAPTPT